MALLPRSLSTPLLRPPSGPSHIDSRCIERVLEVRRVASLDRLDARAAVLCYLRNVSAFHEARANKAVAEAMGNARITNAIDLEFRSVEYAVEELDMITG